jgi:hypothetical protein
VKALLKPFHSILGSKNTINLMTMTHSAFYLLKMKRMKTWMSTMKLRMEMRMEMIRMMA